MILRGTPYGVLVMMRNLIHIYFVIESTHKDACSGSMILWSFFYSEHLGQLLSFHENCAKAHTHEFSPSFV